MIVYWMLLIVCLFLPEICGLYMKKYVIIECDKKRSTPLFYFVIMSAYMIILIGLRSNYIGNDTMGYYNSYKNAASLSFTYLLNEVSDKGFVFIQILFNKLHINFVGFNLIYALFNIVIISYLIYKKSNMPWFSYFLYITFGFFVLEFTMVRQTLAMSIVVLAVLTDKNKTFKDFVKFAVLVLIAYTIHASAIICIPIWFIRKIPFNNKTVIAFFVLIAACYVFKSLVTGIVFNLAGNISDKYEGYNSLETENAGILLYLMILVSVIFGLFISGFLRDKWNQTMFYMLCIMLVIFPAVQGGGAVMRAYYYFYIFLIIYIPNMLNSIDRGKDLPILMLVIMLYLILGLYQFYIAVAGNSNYIVPYQFFWQR